MSSSLVPEKPLLVYPSLATALGLEESVMLCTLTDRITHMPAQESRGFHWYHLSLDDLRSLFPFWNTRDMQRISTRLREQGVIITSSVSLDSGGDFRFAFNDKVQAQIRANSIASSHATQNKAQTPLPPRRQAAPTVATPAKPRRSASPDNTYRVAQTGHFLNKNYIAPNWQPDEITLAQLAQHNITRQFAMDIVPEFITYWHERGEQHHSWGSKFIQHCLRKWRDFEEQRYKKEQEVPMHRHWLPSEDAMDILVRQAGIRREFVEDAIPEFILYWRERGDSHCTWDTKFVQHVRIQWAKFNAAIEHNTDPRPIQANWQPSQDVYDVLRLANIDQRFARELIPEFVLYWRDRGVLMGSWNTKYLQHTKRMWAQRYNSETNFDTRASSKTADRSTRDLTLEEELTDRSWADGL